MTSPALRDTLRLAATVTVVNGFANLTGLPFALYASLAVLSVTVGNYGNTLELGRQRLVGTAIGAMVVFFGYRAWGPLPLVVGLPLALLLARLIAGSLRLTVGYGVCCFVVVMGWLTHDQQLNSWIPLRLLWTAFGILMALLSLRLFWPSRARIQQREGLLQLLVDLGHTLLQVVQHPPEAIQSQALRRRQLGQQIRSLRTSLQGLRDQRQGALLELGTLASQHPVARMWALLDQASEALILDLDELRRQPNADWQGWGLQGDYDAGLAFVQGVVERLLSWRQQLSDSTQLQPPPSQPRSTLSLEALQSPESKAAYRRLSPEQLQRVAAQLMVLNRMDHTMESTERQWRAIVS
ncbi:MULTISPECIES: FUSC family protein [unclassified Cyanobium]|uniref:FUSC family protein n=1 Tax=unclassified Cyanobium TaxID=2627006 RepID=UPI0020CC4074|nr:MULTISPECIES: FUSC family protein [unclassified Cyanobium]MCP9857698.1 FUSC family protein [Cyanobium sp. Cruz-8H5]MCP9864729.1 FUSC family protein [Cyanobium sp. Cruz-8D1]